MAVRVPESAACTEAVALGDGDWGTHGVKTTFISAHGNCWVSRDFMRTAASPLSTLAPCGWLNQLSQTPPR
jgi:hypothetical protein